MKWNNIRITIFKELRGIIRDKKSLQRLLLLPIIIPAIIMLFGFLFDYMENSKYVIGVNYELSQQEKDIVKELENIELKTYKDKKELESKYESREINGYIIKKDNEYTIYTDPTVSSGEIVNSYAYSYLDSYSKSLATEYLVQEQVDPNKVFNNITIKDKSLASEETDSMFTILLSLVITYVLMIVVLACSVVATDATSGEKERGTLETILTFPVRSEELVAGKYLATAILGCLSGILSYILTVPSIYLGKSMFKAFEDITINVNLESTLLVLLVIVVSALLSAGVCIALAGKAKTYKEAQSSLQFISFFPMIPYFVKVMDADTSIFSLVPIANCGMALNDITMNTIKYSDLMVIIISTVVYIVLIIIFISKQYKSEKTLFS